MKIIDLKPIEITIKTLVCLYVGRQRWESGGLEYRKARIEDLKEAVLALDKKSCNDLWRACEYAPPHADDELAVILRNSLGVDIDDKRSLVELAADVEVDLECEYERAEAAEKEVERLKKLMVQAQPDPSSVGHGG